MDPFCDKTKTKGTIVYETGHFMLLYDLRPVVKGHVLFVPKRHVSDLLELNVEELQDMYGIFGYAIPKLLDAYSPKDRSYDLTSQIGEYSGRTIPHLHFHLLPRTKQDIYQKASESIFQELKFNRTHFSPEDVKAETKRLREIMGYAQG